MRGWDRIDLLEKLASIVFCIVTILAVYGFAVSFAVIAKGYRLQRPQVCQVCAEQSTTRTSTVGR